MKLFLFILFAGSVSFLGCNEEYSENDFANQYRQEAPPLKEKNRNVSEKLSSLFSKKGEIIPSNFYLPLGIKDQLGNLYTVAFNRLSKNESVYVYSDIPSNCSDFYCYSNYYIALVQDDICVSLKTFQITLGSSPKVSFATDYQILISNEIEQYSALPDQKGALITDNILDFEKRYSVKEGVLIEV